MPLWRNGGGLEKAGKNRKDQPESIFLFLFVMLFFSFFYSFSLGKTGGISLILFSYFWFSSILLRLIHQADGKNRKDKPGLFPFKSSFILASPRINFLAYIFLVV